MTLFILNILKLCILIVNPNDHYISERCGTHCIYHVPGIDTYQGRVPSPPSPVRTNAYNQQTFGVSAGEFPCELEPEAVVSEAATASATIFRP